MTRAVWAVASSRLDPQQREAVDLAADRHRVISGGPGTGKTLILGHRAARFIAKGMPSQRLRVLTYSKVLAGFVASGMEQLGVPSSCISTFDSWAVRLHKEMFRSNPTERDGMDMFEVAAATVLEELERTGAEPFLDAILLDEAQDLSTVRLRLAVRAAKHVTVALDDRQQLYGGVDTAEVCDILDVPMAAATLLSGFRCTPGILAIARTFLTEEEASLAGSARPLPSQAAQEFPVVECFESDEDEIQRLAELLKQRVRANQTSLVLVPFKDMVKPLGSVLDDHKVPIRLQGGQLDFGVTDPILTTFHSAKGLTFDAVFLPGLRQSRMATYDEWGDRVRQNLIYTGLTRASHWAWIGVRDGDHVPELGPETLDRLQRAGSVSVHRCGEVAPPTPPGSGGARVSRPTVPGIHDKPLAGLLEG